METVETCQTQTCSHIYYDNCEEHVSEEHVSEEYKAILKARKDALDAEFDKVVTDFNKKKRRRKQRKQNSHNIKYISYDVNKSYETIKKQQMTCEKILNYNLNFWSELNKNLNNILNIDKYIKIIKMYEQFSYTYEYSEAIFFFHIDNYILKQNII